MSLALSANAQENKKAPKRGFPMSKELNLSEDQQQKMESLHKDFEGKMKELKDDSNLSKENKQSKTKELREQHMASINQILTPEQQAKVKEMWNKKGKMDKKRIEGKDKEKNFIDGKRGPHKDRMDRREARENDLNLTDDQKDKIKEINDEFKSKSEELRTKHHEALNNVYTPEQQQKLKERKEAFHKDHKFDKNKKRDRQRLDEASKNKLKTLKENFDKEKKAVKLSRIAPDAQKKKIADLREKFDQEKHQIILDSKKEEEKKPQ